jgi:NAD(P)-dependent dehydrogenase (short-subunit alcohol dehydrogenase family)
MDTKDLFKTQPAYKETATHQSMEKWLLASPMGEGTMVKRLPKLIEVAETAVFMASDQAGAMTGIVVNQYIVPMGLN